MPERLLKCCANRNTVETQERANFAMDPKVTVPLGECHRGGSKEQRREATGPGCHLCGAEGLRGRTWGRKQQLVGDGVSAVRFLLLTAKAKGYGSRLKRAECLGFPTCEMGRVAPKRGASPTCRQHSPGGLWAAPRWGTGEAGDGEESIAQGCSVAARVHVSQLPANDASAGAATGRA